MNGRRPRIGVAGTGKWGMNVVKTCANLGYLAAACDTDLRGLEEIRGRYDGVKLFSDFEAMLELGKINAVAIALPAQHHAKFAVRAIEAGMDVLVEKPLALSVADAERVVAAAEESDRKVVVGHVLLYHPAVQAMLKLIASGAIGDLRHMRSRRLGWGRLRSHEDVWWSFAPHDVALMLAIFGEEPQSVTSTSGAYVRPHIADFTYADFRFSLGRSAHIEVSWLDPQRVSQTDVFGSSGTLSFIDGPEGGRLLLIPCGDRLSATGEVELYKGDASIVKVPTGEPLANEVEAFARAARGGRLPVTDVREGLAVVRTLAMVHERCGSQLAESGSL